MQLDELISVISDVEIMGGSVADMLASSKIAAIAEAVLCSGAFPASVALPDRLPATRAWIATVPAYMHDCFNG